MITALRIMFSLASFWILLEVFMNFPGKVFVKLGDSDAERFCLYLRMFSVFIFCGVLAYKIAMILIK